MTETDYKFGSTTENPANQHIDADIRSRAQGCFLGQLSGDALGSLVEFRTPDQIRQKYPNGVRILVDGGTWNTIAGQPTDDSEMALMLARMLVDQGRYDAEHARKAYRFWLDSAPFDCGMTISSGLRGRPNRDSQANGALMRISPLGIFGGFYKRGCQEKTPLYVLRSGCFSDIQPLFAVALLGAGAWFCLSSF